MGAGGRRTLPIASLEKGSVSRDTGEGEERTYIALSKNSSTPPIRKKPPRNPSALTSAPKHTG